MKVQNSLITLKIFVVAATCGAGLSTLADDEWESLFDGKTLKGWDGDPQLWSVQDGAITGRTTPQTTLKKNSFIIWRGGEVDNFELEFEYRIINGNSGIQYRSFENPDPEADWSIYGYQADFEAGDQYSGILYGEGFRDVLAHRGEVTELTRDRNGNFVKLVIDQIGDSDEIQQQIKKEEWNSYRIVASGFRFEHFINGTKTIECVDNDLQQRRASGLLALQIHRGPPMLVQCRNIRLKKLTTIKNKN